MKSFSPFNPTKSPYKIALFKNLNLAPSFPPTKNAKKDFSSNPPKNKNFMKGLKSESRGDQQKEKDQTHHKKEKKKKEFKRKSLKKKEFKKERV